MTKKIYRVGVIGTGAIAQALHLPGYQAAKNCEVVAVAEPEKKCIEMCRKAGLPIGTVYSDYREMLKKEALDVVSICTPNALHKEMAVAAAKAGCTILLEKPIALSLAETKAIDAAVKKNGVRIMTGFSHRFNALNVQARKALNSGKIGRPQMIRIRFSHGGPQPGWAKTEWFYNPELAGGGATLDMGIHAFDLAAWYLGRVTSVQATVTTLRKKIKVDDNAICLLGFETNCLGQIEVGWTSQTGFLGVEIVGDNGSIRVDYRTNTAVMIRGVTRPDGTATMEESILCAVPEKGAWPLEMEYFTAKLGAKTPYSPGLEDGIASLQVALAAYRSHQTGKRIAIH